MDQARIIASKMGDLPTLPHVATKVIELVSDPNSSAGDLEKVILRDQALTARVLKIANSALFGRQGKISTSSHAIVLMGYKAVQSLVITASTETVYRSTNVGFKDKLLWEHALGVALAAKFLAQECRYTSVEEAFLGGLLHDIGKVALDRNLGERYQAVVERVYNEGFTFLEAEQEMLGFDHMEVGALMIKKWNMSPALEEAVRLHHQPMASAVNQSLCAIVSLANSVCLKLGIGPERMPDLNLAQLDVTARLKIAPERLALIVQTAEAKLTEEKELFNLA